MAIGSRFHRRLVTFGAPPLPNLLFVVNPLLIPRGALASLFPPPLPPLHLLPPLLTSQPHLRPGQQPGKMIIRGGIGVEILQYDKVLKAHLLDQIKCLLADVIPLLFTPLLHLLPPLLLLLPPLLLLFPSLNPSGQHH